MARTKAEIGSVGLPLFSGRLSLDTNVRLRGRQATQIYRKMAENEPAAAAFLSAAFNLLRTDLGVNPGGNTDADKAAAEYLESTIHDMRDACGTYLRQLYGAIIFGYAILEQVFKRRSGGNGSRYDDGKVAWAAWALRRQESFEKWETDTNGRVVGFTQRPAPTYDLRTIPLNKAIHVVTDDTEGSPEGRSALRPMYVPLFFVEQIRNLYGITLERGAGLPVFEFLPDSNPPPADWETTVDAIFLALRQNEESGISVPKGLKFSFAPLPGVDGASYRDAIQFFQVWALAAALADFVALGTGQTGSFALGKDKSELFLLALNGYQDRVLNAINRQAVPKLFRYNDLGTLTALPEFTLPAVRRYDLESLGNFARVLHDIGAFHPTPEDEEALRRISDLPDLDLSIIKKLFAEDKVMAAPGAAQPVQCPECGAMNMAGAERCAECGAPLPQVRGGRMTGSDVAKVETANEEGTDEEEVSVSEDEEAYV